jgi:RNA polymerase sigma factor (sigma-70 family)
MVAPSGVFDDSLADVNRCLKGDSAALARLRDHCHPSLLNILLSRGASRTETEDLLADLWFDCVPGADDKPSLLEKFNGKSRLLGWLSTVAIRRWIDMKRRQARTVSRDDSDEEGGPGEMEPARDRLHGEDALIELLRSSLQHAFTNCSTEVTVLLRLRYIHNLSQRELVRMLGWHESKISRLLSSSMEDIQAVTLAEIKRRDPWLRLTWEDLLDLCDNLGTGFL